MADFNGIDSMIKEKIITGMKVVTAMVIEWDNRDVASIDEYLF